MNLAPCAAAILPVAGRVEGAVVDHDHLGDVAQGREGPSQAVLAVAHGDHGRDV